MRRAWFIIGLLVALVSPASADIFGLPPPFLLPVKSSVAAPLTIACAGTASTSSTVSCSGTYTGTAPTSFSSAVWQAPCSDSVTPPSPSFAGGTWGPAAFPTPSGACTGPILVTTNLSTTATSGNVVVSAPGFTGPGDIAAYTSFYSCSRGLSAAYATGSNPACELLNVSTSGVQVINILSNGKFDTASANTFAGSHTTCTSMTMTASATATFVGCGATPNKWDFISGTVGSGTIVQPLGIVSCGTFIGGGGTCTMISSMTVSLTGVSVQNALTVFYFADQSVTSPIAQVGGGALVPWFPDCGASIPCAWGDGTQNYTTAPTAILNANSGFTAVAGRFGNYTSYGLIQQLNAGNFPALFFNNSANSGLLTNSTNQPFSMADNVVHSIEGVQGTSGFVYVDATQTSGLNTGALGSTTGPIVLMGNGTNGMTGPWYESGTPAAAYTSGGGGTALQTHANQCAYYGTTC